MLCRGRKNVCEGCPSVYGGIQGSEGHESGVSVTSATAEKIQDVDGESYTVYKIRCSVMGVGGEQQEVGTGNGGSPACCWQVCRRYTEFHQLDNLLRSLGTVLLDLPSKNPFASVLGSIRKSREVGLRDYLNAVLSHCNDKQCVLLSCFLHVNRHLRLRRRCRAPKEIARESKDVKHNLHVQQQYHSPAVCCVEQARIQDKGPSPVRGRMPSSTAERENRSWIKPREVVAGVPHSSLHGCWMDDDSARLSAAASKHVMGGLVSVTLSCSSADEVLLPSSAWRENIGPVLCQAGDESEAVGESVGAEEVMGINGGDRRFVEAKVEHTMQPVFVLPAAHRGLPADAHAFHSSHQIGGISQSRGGEHIDNCELIRMDGGSFSSTAANGIGGAKRECTFRIMAPDEDMQCAASGGEIVLQGKSGDSCQLLSPRCKALEGLTVTKCPMVRGMDGTKAGVGLFFVQSVSGGECVVDEVISGSAAHMDGRIVVGDVLLRVDGVCVSDKDLLQIRALIIGKQGTNVTLELSRGGWKLTVCLKRCAQQLAGSAFTGGGDGLSPATNPTGAAYAAGVVTPSPHAHTAPAVTRLSSAREHKEMIGKGHSSRLEQTGQSVKQGYVQSCAASQSLSLNGVPEECDKIHGIEHKERVRAVCAFLAQREHEVSLCTGDVLLVTRKHESGWWEGIHEKSAARGWFPSNHCASAHEVCGSYAQGYRTGQDTPEEDTAHHQETSDCATMLQMHAHDTHCSHGSHVVLHAAASKRDQIGGHRSCIAEALLDRKDQDVQQSSCVLQSALGKRLSYGSGVSVLSLSRRSTEFANDASSTSCASSDGFQTSVSDFAGGRVSTHGTHDEGSKMLQMGVDEVLHWLRGMDLGEYADAFCANKIDGEMLLDLTESDLMEDFGMTNKYHRRCIMRCITASK